MANVLVRRAEALRIVPERYNRPTEWQEIAPRGRSLISTTGVAN